MHYSLLVRNSTSRILCPVKSTAQCGGDEKLQPPFPRKVCFFTSGPARLLGIYGSIPTSVAATTTRQLTYTVLLHPSLALARIFRERGLKGDVPRRGGIWHVENLQKAQRHLIATLLRFRIQFASKVNQRWQAVCFL